jgi:hypothetical protein
MDDNAVRILGMAKDWGKKGKSKGVAEDGDNTNTEDEDEEDKAAQQFLLRGYPITGWEMASVFFTNTGICVSDVAIRLFN